MTKQRDYRAEYQRRVERGISRGMSRSQARGHPRTVEPYASGRNQIRYDRDLEEGIKELRAGKSLQAASAIIHVRPERLRRYAVEAGVAEKHAGRWRIADDRRPREVALYTAGRERAITVPGYAESQYVGRYMAAVGAFRASNDPAHLRPFRGEGVRDTRGRLHRFETRLNELYRLTAAGPSSFEQVYRIVA